MVPQNRSTNQQASHATADVLCRMVPGAIGPVLFDYQHTISATEVGKGGAAVTMAAPTGSAIRIHADALGVLPEKHEHSIGPTRQDTYHRSEVSSPAASRLASRLGPAGMSSSSQLQLTLHEATQGACTSPGQPLGEGVDMPLDPSASSTVGVDNAPPTHAQVNESNEHRIAYAVTQVPLVGLIHHAQSQQQWQGDLARRSPFELSCRQPPALPSADDLDNMAAAYAATQQHARLADLLTLQQQQQQQQEQPPPVTNNQATHSTGEYNHSITVGTVREPSQVIRQQHTDLSASEDMQAASRTPSQPRHGHHLSLSQISTRDHSFSILGQRRGSQQMSTAHQFQEEVLQLQRSARSYTMQQRPLSITGSAAGAAVMPSHESVSLRQKSLLNLASLPREGLYYLVAGTTADNGEMTPKTCAGDTKAIAAGAQDKTAAQSPSSSGNSPAISAAAAAAATSPYPGFGSVHPSVTVAFNIHKVQMKRNRGSRKELILGQVQGVFTPFTMSAILGPSGCGKSTLLDVLRGHRLMHRKGARRSVAERFLQVIQQEQLPCLS